MASFSEKIKAVAPYSSKDENIAKTVAAAKIIDTLSPEKKLTVTNNINALYDRITAALKEKNATAKAAPAKTPAKRGRKPKSASSVPAAPKEAPKKRGRKPKAASAAAPAKRKKVSLTRSYSTTSKRDGARNAKSIGRRVSKTGNTYYEYRENRVDFRQPSKSQPMGEKFATGGFFGLGSSDSDSKSKTKGRAWTKEHYNQNKQEKYEVPLELRKFSKEDRKPKPKYKKIKK
jgi:hypothetical protein